MMSVPSTLLKRKLVFWQSHGLIEEIKKDVYQLCEETKDDCNNQPEDVIVEEYEAESAMASAEDQREEELQVCALFLNIFVARGNSFVRQDFKARIHV